jgi:phospholipid/cholesterol/gamma-HCH transport system ATP-binding protein
MRVEVRDLHRRFEQNRVLRGVTLEIPQNQVTLIVGGSGCGKTVLLKHLIGLLKPDRGQVIVDGTDIAHIPERRLTPIRQRFGMVFQSGALLNSMTVEENVGLGLRERRRMPWGPIREIVAEKLELVGLGGKQHEMPSSLSGGMKKRVAIARALTMDPEIFLYDEPTTGLDPPMATAIDNLISELAERLKKTTVVVTHDLVSIFSIADQVAMIHEGRIVFRGTPQEMERDSQEIVQRFIARR